MTPFLVIAALLAAAYVWKKRKTATKPVVVAAPTGPVVASAAPTLSVYPTAADLLKAAFVLAQKEASDHIAGAMAAVAHGDALEAFLKPYAKPAAAEPAAKE